MRATRRVNPLAEKEEANTLLFNSGDRDSQPKRQLTNEVQSSSHETDGRMEGRKEKREKKEDGGKKKKKGKARRRQNERSTDRSNREEENVREWQGKKREEKRGKGRESRV